MNTATSPSGQRLLCVITSGIKSERAGDSRTVGSGQALLQRLGHLQVELLDLLLEAPEARQSELLSEPAGF